MRTQYFEPGLNQLGAGKSKATRNSATMRGTEARRRVLGATGGAVAVLFARNSGSYGGRRGNSVFVVLQIVNAAPRYVLQFFESDGTQIGSTIVENGTSLNGLASTLASNANGAHFSLQVVNNTNQATEDTGNGFANSTKMNGAG